MLFLHSVTAGGVQNTEITWEILGLHTSDAAHRVWKIQWYLCYFLALSMKNGIFATLPAIPKNLSNLATLAEKRACLNYIT